MSVVTIRLDADGFATVQSSGVTSRISFPRAQFAEEPDQFEAYGDFCRDYCEQFERFQASTADYGLLSLLRRLAAPGDEIDH